MTDQINSSANKSGSKSNNLFQAPIGASPSLGNTGSAFPGVSPAGSHMPGRSNLGGRMEPSNL